ncbi:pepsin/retropepsin-like aspartic protease family protein [Stakelama marina]|uniref:Aspartyl protease family protein n=1 Tax=Stakelama marina TaxID=2826939 RepID=A0A8T4IFP7_9SPHN|nr:pepsin/retropepsin-like aspartic protease family protein [Stakelama marina]MBR0553403.1 aspartyl protease family protein [Stakelama marina]
MRNTQWEIPMRVSSLLLALALALSSASPARQPDPGSGDSIPFELDHGHIFVSAYVDGHGPYRFGFDSGASGMGRADVALTAELSLPKTGQAENSDGVRVTSTDIVSARSLRVGNLERHDVRLLSRDYNGGRKSGVTPMMGIIARDFFADRTVIIDYPARTIRFSAQPLRPDEQGVVRYGRSFAIPVCFAKACFPAKVDTGSSRGLVIPKQIAQRFARGTPTRIGSAARTNSSVTLYAVDLDPPMRVGKMAVTSRKALYAEPSSDTTIIGSDFLKDYVLTIDPRHRLLQISEPERD